MGLAPQHVGSSWTRDLTHVPYNGWQILNHWTTREVPIPLVSVYGFPLLQSAGSRVQGLSSWAVQA